MDLPDLGRGLDRAARHALPAASIVVVIVLLAMPDLIPAQPACRAAFVIASVYFWCLYRPASLPAPIIALIGVLLDLLGASPLGLWAVLLLLEQAAVGAVRKALVRQSFLIVWLAFIGFAVAISALDWAGRAVLDLTLFPPEPIVTQGVIAILLYPVLAIVLIRAHRSAAAPERA